MIFGHPFYLTLTEGGARLFIILHAAWRSFPLEMLLIAAGMTAIPVELYEVGQGGRRRHVVRSSDTSRCR